MLFDEWTYLKTSIYLAVCSVYVVVAVSVYVSERHAAASRTHRLNTIFVAKRLTEECGDLELETYFAVTEFVKGLQQMIEMQ